MLSERLASIRAALKGAVDRKTMSATLEGPLTAELDAAIEEAQAIEARPVPLFERLTTGHIDDPDVVLWPVVARSRENGS